MTPSFTARALVRRIPLRVRCTINHGLRAAYGWLPLPGATSPVFVVGCGRSGTTILGYSLGCHPQITYLNERRDLWFAAYPETDIWSSQAAQRAGTLAMEARHADPIRTQRLQRLFHFETLKTKRPVLVEKLPINNFRLGFIESIFPDARFIYIRRNGIEVARSIEKKCPDGNWYGEDDYKWRRLAEYAARSPETSSLPALAETHYEKGLLEWRLSTEAAIRFLTNRASGSFIEISYKGLTDDPLNTLSAIFDFLGLPLDPAVQDFARTNIQRRSAPLASRPLTDTEKTIGGSILLKSLDDVPLLT